MHCKWGPIQKISRITTWMSGKHSCKHRGKSDNARDVKYPNLNPWSTQPQRFRVRRNLDFYVEISEAVVKNTSQPTEGKAVLGRRKVEQSLFKEQSEIGSEHQEELVSTHTKA